MPVDLKAFRTIKEAYPSVSLEVNAVQKIHKRPAPEGKA